MKTVQVNNDFPPGFFEAIGQLAVAFGRLEYEMKLAVKTLSGKGFSQGMAEAESYGQFYWRCERTKALAEKELLAPHLEIFIRLIDEAKVLAPERNNNFHALWTTKSGKPVRYCPHMDKKTKTLVWLPTSVTIPDLEDLATTLRNLYNAIRTAKKAWPTIGK